MRSQRIKIKTPEFVSRYLIIDLVGIAFLIIIWFVAKMVLNLELADEYLVDFVVITGFVEMFVFHIKDPRHFFVATFLIIVSALCDILGKQRAVFFASSTAIGFFAIGLINLLVFDKKVKKG